MHRIEPYELIDVSKVGTINYYSLTSKGRRLLGQYHQKFQEPSTEAPVPEKLILLILDELATQIAKDKPIIAEDLGDISESVVKLVDDSGFPGMRVFQFAFLSA